jgi:hypothetical protein
MTTTTTTMDAVCDGLRWTKEKSKDNTHHITLFNNSINNMDALFFGFFSNLPYKQPMKALPFSLALLFLLNSVSSFQPHDVAACRNPSTSTASKPLFRIPRHASSSSSSLVVLFAAKTKHMSAADKERRDEDSRRQQRKDDVVVGKTSAKAGEKDYQLNPKATEEEYLRQASAIERKIYQWTGEGMEMLKMVCIMLLLLLRGVIYVSVFGYVVAVRRRLIIYLGSRVLLLFLLLLLVTARRGCTSL